MLSPWVPLGQAPRGHLLAQPALSQRSLLRRDDDDINDVASMAGVNLSEESARILATNSELVGTLTRSCKDETFLLPAPLQRRILEIGMWACCRPRGPPVCPPGRNPSCGAALGGGFPAGRVGPSEHTRCLVLPFACVLHGWCRWFAGSGSGVDHPLPLRGVRLGCPHVAAGSESWASVKCRSPPGRKHGITELHPDVVSYVSHATQQRLQNLVEKISETAQQKNFSYKVMRCPPTLSCTRCRGQHECLTELRVGKDAATLGP